MEVFLGIFSILLYIIVPIIVIYIQVKLSKSKNKYLGLILPLLSFLFSFTTVFVVGPPVEIIDGVAQSIESINNDPGAVDIFLFC